MFGSIEIHAASFLLTNDGKNNSAPMMLFHEMLHAGHRIIKQITYLLRCLKHPNILGVHNDEERLVLEKVNRLAALLDEGIRHTLSSPALLQVKNVTDHAVPAGHDVSQNAHKAALVDIAALASVEQYAAQSGILSRSVQPFVIEQYVRMLYRIDRLKANEVAECVKLLAGKRYTKTNVASSIVGLFDERELPTQIHEKARQKLVIDTYRSLESRESFLLKIDKRIEDLDEGNERRSLSEMSATLHSMINA